jgi:3-oxoacyl-[acyl-carrier-protein] synthase-3
VKGDDLNLPISIKSIGTALPNTVLFSSQMDAVLGFQEGSIEKITGLHKRYVLDNQTPSELTLEAVQIALKQAQMTIEDIDCIIQSGATMEQAIPYNAAGVHRLLNPHRPIPSFDINMTCLSVLRAFDIAARMLDSYRNILLVSCDIASIGVDWKNIRTAGIFGDGAAAMIVSSSQHGGILVSNFETHSVGYDYCRVRGAGSKCPPASYNGDYKEMCYFEMDGKRLYKLTSKILPNFILKTLASIHLSMEDIDWVVPHQASQSALDHMAHILHIDPSKMVDIFKTHGNQIASSIPFALHHLMNTHTLIRGQKVMFVGTSAGVGLGLIVWEVP